MTIYSEHETRPEGERAVLFFRQTYSVRLYETEGKLYSRNNCDRRALKREVFLQAADLTKVFSIHQLNQHLHNLTLSRYAGVHVDHDPKVPLSVARALWQVMQAVGDLVKQDPAQQKKRGNTYTVDLSLANSPEGVQRVSEMPKQARQLVAMLTGLNQITIHEKDLKQAVDELASTGGLKTKSEPWRIWSFYAPQLYDMGLVKYQGRRVGESDDGGEEEAVAA